MIHITLLVLSALHAAAADLVGIDLRGAAAVSPRIASKFASLSLEVPVAPLYLAMPDGSPRPSFVRLMQLLANVTRGAGPNIRIGGSSTDMSVYTSSPNEPLPNGSNYRITDADFKTYAAVRLWNGTVTPGLTFRYANDTSWAVNHACALATILPWTDEVVEAVEIGNEVDIYTQNGIRPSTYNGSVYMSEFATFAAALKSCVPANRIQGAVFESIGFFPVLASYIDTYAPALRSISVHEYALGHCVGQHPTVWNLLASDATWWRLNGSDPSNPTTAIRTFVPIARDAGQYFVIGEGNSASCGGQPGVSDAFAATLWAMDTMFAHASAGLSRWNFHGGGTPPSFAHYSPIGYTDTDTDAPVVQPLFYALWAFTEATRHYAQVLNATVAIQPAAAAAYISVWCVQDERGQQRVVVIHKDGNATQPATVTVTPSAPTTSNATATRLGAQHGGVFATSGIVYRGMSFDNSTTPGVPAGEPDVEVLQPEGPSSAYTATVPPASVLFIELPIPAAR